MSRNVYIIAGPNGAGKTTFARKFLPQYADCRIFINADLIAQGLSPLQPEAAAFHAGRLMLEEIDHHTALGVDFGFETTLSGRSYLPMIGHLKENDYKIHFFYLVVPTPDLALQRVADRVKAGGHDIPQPVLYRRFDRSLLNFFSRYRDLGDSWMIFDNSGPAPVLVT